jgi:hypothetical protein
VRGLWCKRLHIKPSHPPKTTPVGFEATRGDPIGLAGRRLNRSAKVSMSTSLCGWARELVIFTADLGARLQAQLGCLAVCVYTHTCMYVGMWVFVHACMYACMYFCLCVQEGRCPGHGVVWCGMLWCGPCGIVWYGMVCCGMVWNAIACDGYAHGTGMGMRTVYVHARMWAFVHACTRACEQPCWNSCTHTSTHASVHSFTYTCGEAPR